MGIYTGVKYGDVLYGEINTFNLHLFMWVVLLNTSVNSAFHLKHMS